MLLNSMSLWIKPIQSSSLMPYYLQKSYTDANADIASYVTAGYKLFDMAATSAAHGFDAIPATTSTALLCVWKKAYPYGVYNMLSTQIGTTSFDIAVFGCKVSTATSLVVSSSDAFLDVYFTQFGWSSSNNQTMNNTMEYINAHFLRTDGNKFNFSGFNFANMQYYNHYGNTTLNMAGMNNVGINAYQPLVLNNPSAALMQVNNVVNDVVGNGYTVNVGQIPGRNICSDGIYLYSQNISSPNLIRIPISTFTSASVASVNVGQNAYNVLTDGIYVYSVMGGVNTIIRVPINSFTSGSVTTVNMGQSANWIAIDGTNIYSANSVNATVIKIPIGTWTSASVSSVNTGLTNINQLITDGTYLYMVNLSSTITRIPIATWTSASVSSIGTATTYNTCMTFDGNNVYCQGNIINNISKIPVATWSTVNISSIDTGMTAFSMCCDGLYIYNSSPNSNNIMRFPIASFTSNSLTKYNINQSGYICTDGINIYNQSGNTLLKMYIVNQSINTNNFAVYPAINTTYLTASTSGFLAMQGNINQQYQIFYSLLGKTTRNLYNIQFRPDAAIPDSLKRFNANTNWLWKRYDAESFLVSSAGASTATSGSVYINNLNLYNPSSTLGYDFTTKLPADENILMRAVSSSGDEQIFEWYNLAIRNTIINQGVQFAKSNLNYYITHCFNILEFETIQDLFNVTPNYSNGALQGSVLMNSLDNEVLA